MLRHLKQKPLGKLTNHPIITYSDPGCADEFSRWFQPLQLDGRERWRRCRPGERSHLGADLGTDLGSGSTSVQTWGQTWGAGPLQAQAQAQAQTHPRPRRLDQVCLLSEASANQTQDWGVVLLTGFPLCSWIFHTLGLNSTPLSSFAVSCFSSSNRFPNKHLKCTS